MKAYSQDLRDRVIRAIEAGFETRAEIAERFEISIPTVDNWRRRYHHPGACVATPRQPGPKRVLAICDADIRAAVTHQPDVTLAELCDQMQAQHAVTASASMMSRTLRLLNLPRKKKTLSDSQQTTPRVQALRKDFLHQRQAELLRILKRLHFLDEMGVHLGLTRLYGRAAPGERVVEHTPGHSGTRYTVLAALSVHGVTAPWFLEGALDGLAWRTYVESTLAPTLRKGDVVIADRLSSHFDAAAQAAIEARGARLMLLPPYSPDFNPIELCWAKVKTAVRAAKARTEADLLAALAAALRAVSPSDAQHWLKHCGYEAC